MKLPGAARSDNRPRGGGSERHAGGRRRHSVPRRRGGGGSGETRGGGRSLVLWRCRGCGVAPLWCSRGGESHGGSRGRGARRGASGKSLSGACSNVRGGRLVAAFSRHHLHGVRAPLGLEVAEAAPEVGVFAVEGGRPRLQRLHGEGMFFLGHREGAGVRCLTCWIVFVRRRSCEGEAGLQVLGEMEPVRARRVDSMLAQTGWRHPKWAGGPRGPPRGALGDTGASGRRPWERSVPEPEMARTADETIGEDVS